MVHGVHYVKIVAKFNTGKPRK